MENYPTLGNFLTTVCTYDDCHLEVFDMNMRRCIFGGIRWALFNQAKTHTELQEFLWRYVVKDIQPIIVGAEIPALIISIDLKR